MTTRTFPFRDTRAAVDPGGSGSAHPGAYEPERLTRADVDALRGATLLEFGTNWCGWCRAAQPVIRQALSQAPGLRHLKIEDGPGQPLGRSFGVKLWPTLVFLRDGVPVAKLVRPSDEGAISAALRKLGQE